MAAVEVTISGVLYDKLSRTTRPVVLIGEASLTGLEVGGGPMPPGQGGGGSPPGIWGPTDPRPTPPIHLPPGSEGGGSPPGIWGPTDPRPGWGLPPVVGIWPNPGHPEHPIVIPPVPVPPNMPDLPEPGSPPVLLPGTTPTHPMVPPAAIVVEYPGMGKVVVPQPLMAQPK